MECCFGVPQETRCTFEPKLSILCTGHSENTLEENADCCIQERDHVCDSNFYFFL